MRDGATWRSYRNRSDERQSTVEKLQESLQIERQSNVEKLQESLQIERRSNVDKLSPKATDTTSDERRSYVDGYRVGDLDRTDL